jgi:hypothetical protein
MLFMGSFDFNVHHHLICNEVDYLLKGWNPLSFSHIKVFQIAQSFIENVFGLCKFEVMIKLAIVTSM